MRAVRPDSERWVEVTPSQFGHEREGLEHVRDALPDAEPYRAWSNLEIITGKGQSLEVDLLVIGPAGLYLVELKGWHGRISGDRYHWTLTDRGTVVRDNPWLDANKKARVLATVLREALFKHASAKGVKIPPHATLPWVQAAVFLHDPGVACELPPQERTWVYGREGAEARSNLPGLVNGLLTRRANDPKRTVPPGRSRLLANLLNNHSGMGRRRRRTVSGYVLDPHSFDQGDRWQDYLARHERYPDERKRVRIFYVGHATTAEERATLERAAERDYRILRHIQHPGLIAPTQHVETPDGPALIYPYDERAQRLDHLLTAHASNLSLDTRLAVIRGLAESLRYAHGRHIAHRGLSPRSIYVDLKADDGPRVQVVGWHTGARMPGTEESLSGSPGGSTIGALLDPTTQVYQAPEVMAGVEVDPVRLDVFSLGAISYLIIAGRPPATDPIELRRRLNQETGLDLAAHMDAAPAALRDLTLKATSGDVTARLQDVEMFLARLAEAERTDEEPELPPDLDPLDQHPPGTILQGRWKLRRRLGSGSTAVALFVEDQGNGNIPRVLKIAHDEERAVRLASEAEALEGLDDDTKVARLVEDAPLRIGNRTALLVEYAGDETLAGLLRQQRRLSLDLLERFGQDLLAITAYLERERVDHRDIKPANLGVRPRPSDRQKHLVLFDFSLSKARPTDLTAGTPPYLDPFLGHGTRHYWDNAAERYSVAATLFEMATGRTPSYGDGQSRADVLDVEATVAPGMFDPAVAEPLVAFFTKALRRDARERFDNAEEMQLAWTRVFATIAAASTDTAEKHTGKLAPDTPLGEVGLSDRAVSALEPLGITTVGGLLATSGGKLASLRGVNEATRRELRAWHKRLSQPSDSKSSVPPGDSPISGPDDQEPEPTLVRGIDAVIDRLIPRLGKKNANEIRAARLLLGRPAADGDQQLSAKWLLQNELGQLLDLTSARAQQLDKKLRERWSTNRATNPLTTVRDDLVEFVRTSGGVVTAEEAAEALLALRGSSAAEPRRTAQAIGLVRAAAESELERGGAARLDRQWQRHSGIALIATEPTKDTDAPKGTQRISYATALGRAAASLVGEGEAPVPANRAAEHLRQVEAPDGFPPLDDARLIRLAASASGSAAVSNRGELYRHDLSALTALRHSGVAFATVGTVNEETLREEVQARYPRAQPLPARPALDDLLAEVGSRLFWSSESQAYMAPSITGQRLTTLWSRATDDGDESIDAQIDLRLRASLQQHGFLAIGAERRRIELIPPLLAKHYGVRVVDLGESLIREMRTIAGQAGIPWSQVLQADAADPGSTDGEGLRGLVGEAMDAVRTALTAPGEPVLLTEAGVLARYGHMGLLAGLADHTTTRPAAVWLLVPLGMRVSGPLLDRVQVPTLSQAQWLRLPADWLHRRQAYATADGGVR